MRTKVMILFVGFFLISLVSAAEIPTYQQNEDFTIERAMYNYNMTPCLTCNCNVSIFYPNGTALVRNAAGDNVGSFCQYNSSSTILGRHLVEVSLNNGVDYGAGSWYIEISPTGITQSTAQGINSAIFLVLILCLTGITGFLGFKFLRNDYLWVLGVFFVFLMFLFIVYDVWLGYEFHRTLTGINDGSNLPATIFWMFMFILVAGLLTSGALLFRYWKRIKKWFLDAKSDQEEEDLEDERNWR